jgi:hypothetical protein
MDELVRMTVPFVVSLGFQCRSLNLSLDFALDVQRIRLNEFQLQFPLLFRRTSSCLLPRTIYLCRAEHIYSSFSAEDGLQRCSQIRFRPTHSLAKARKKVN